MMKDRTPTPNTAASTLEAGCPDRPGVLHNMSARPYTPVSFTVRPIRTEWAAFTMPGRFRLDPGTRDRLDAVWSSLAFTGAALVQSGSTPPGITAVHTCVEPDICANIVLRTRGTLLLAEMCLIDDVEGLLGATLVSSDPRLVRWAGGRR